MNDLNEMQNSNYERKKNNGKGVFYGVIAVATLIVAIIGATFAYFTAQAQSTAGALSATAATVSINYTEGRSIQATNLVPASATVVAQAYHQPTAKEYNEDTKNNLTCSYDSNTDTYTGTGCKNKGDVGTKCVDDNGYFVCAWYEFSVTNSSNISQAINAYMSIGTNNFKTLDRDSIKNQKGTETIKLKQDDPEDKWNYNFPEGSSNRALYDSLAGNTNNNLALKFMTVRSADTVDVEATVCSTQSKTDDSNVATTDFCGSNGSEDLPFTWDKDTNKGLSGITDAEKASDYTKSLYTDNATGKKYYAYNTTAIRQSMKQAGEQQEIFTQEIIPTAVTCTQADVEAGNIAGCDAVGKVRKDCDAIGAVGQGNLTCGTTRTFYVLVWLEENRFVGSYTCPDPVDGKADKEAQDCDQGKTYAATITVQATGSGDSGNGGYVTGTMNPTQP